MHEENQWKYVIEPPQRRIELNFRELWRYRDLVLLFVKRDFISRYKQTILGPLWAIVNPVLTTVIFTIVFGNLAKLPTMDTAQTGKIIVPGFLFYMTGNILWGYFSETLKNIANVFVKNADTMKKVYYPRLASPVAIAIFNLTTLFIRMALFVILLLIYMYRGAVVIQPSAMLIMLPMLIAELVLFSVGTGLIVSAFTAKYRDAIMLVDFGLQLGLYVTPVAYGLQLVPESWLGVYMLNPVTSILTTMRYLCFGEGFFQMRYFIQGWIITIAIFLIGIILFNRTEKNFVDTV